MSEFLHPSQLEAIEKLKQLRVGALYISRQNGKLRTVLSLVRFRLRRLCLEYRWQWHFVLELILWHQRIPLCAIGFLTGRIKIVLVRIHKL